MSKVSQGAAARQVSRSFSAALPQRPAGQLCPFTRHPKTLARVVLLELRPAARFTLDVLLTFADRDGWCWPKVREIQAAAPRSARVKRYSEATIKRSLRELKAAGLLNWERIPAFGHYPGRPDRKGPAVGGAGEFTMSGGRAWRVNFAAIAAAADRRSATRGMPSAGKITSDPAGEITSDRPSESVSRFARNCETRSRARADAGRSAGAFGASCGKRDPSTRRERRGTAARSAGSRGKRDPTWRRSGKSPDARPTHQAPARDRTRGGSEEQPAGQGAATPTRRRVVDEELERGNRASASTALLAIERALRGET